MTARVAQEHHIFSTLVSSPEGPMSSIILAEKTAINPTVLSSLLEYLATQYMVEEVSPGFYAATKLSHVLQAPLFVDGTIHL